MFHNCPEQQQEEQQQQNDPKDLGSKFPWSKMCIKTYLEARTRLG